MDIEELQVIGGAPVPTHVRMTFGVLEDGTPFRATCSHGNAARVQVRIVFGDEAHPVTAGTEA